MKPDRPPRPPRVCLHPSICEEKAAHHAAKVGQWLPLAEALHHALRQQLEEQRLTLYGVGMGAVNTQQVYTGVSARDILTVIRDGRPFACFVDRAGANLPILCTVPHRTLHITVRLQMTWPSAGQRLSIASTAAAVITGAIAVQHAVVIRVEDPANNPARWWSADGYAYPHCFCHFPPEDSE